MTHRAKRISSGVYIYRGWKIEEVGRYGENGSQWNVIAPNEQHAEDAYNYLYEAKDAIDRCENNRLT